ncbi:hypothetical protein, partial [Gilliamella sp. wkB108]|uniref:hypothetical protein n=1 Tax=Gilliamella sp. wkB108 TaxID=3120256 RepID=UPI0011469B00
MFRGIIEKPILFEALGRLLINYQSEWYSEVGTDGKMPEWEALNSEMTDDAENALDYLKDGDEVKRDAYLKNIGKTADSEEAIGLNQRRERISRFPENYEENPKEKLNQEQFKDYNYMHELEVKVEMWEKEKEKIKKCLWWKDVVNGLANQNQPTAEDNAGNVSGANTQTAQTDTSPPATLNQDGKAWYIHPISIINYFSAKTYL